MEEKPDVSCLAEWGEASDWAPADDPLSAMEVFQLVCDLALLAQGTHWLF